GTKRIGISLIALCAGLLGRPAEALAQCAMCGAAAGSSTALARGLALSIFFLLGALAFVVGWLVVLVMGTERRARLASAAATASGRPASIPSPSHAGRAPDSR